jgi:anti-sigma B factor antagonist
MKLTQTHDGTTGFAVATEPVDWDGTLAVARGEMDIAAVPALRKLLDDVIGGGTRRLVIDLTDVDFVDSVALATLIGAKRRIGESGRLAIVATHPYVLLVFEATGLHHVVSIVPSREAAVAEVTA